jgi:hypothetical protein
LQVGIAKTMSNKKIYFEISERKMILLFDVFFVVVALYFSGKGFELGYLKASVSNFM